MTNSDEIVQQRRRKWVADFDRENVARIQRLAQELNLSFMEASAAIHSTDMEVLGAHIDNVALSGPDQLTIENFDYYMDILVEKLNG